MPKPRSSLQEQTSSLLSLQLLLCSGFERSFPREAMKQQLQQCFKFLEWEKNEFSRKLAPLGLRKFFVYKGGASNRLPPLGRTMFS